MPAISDSSALILFAKIGRFDLLRLVFTELLIPTAVQHEVAIAGGGRPGAMEIEDVPWIRVQAPRNMRPGARPFGPLGAGETEVIALALEIGGGEPLLLDDRIGRRIANRYGLRVVGSAGALVLARDMGLISSVTPLLDRLRESGLRLSESAYREILTTARESAGPSGA